MIELALKVPREFTLACSGGVDSMVALDFFRKGKKKIRVAHYNHGTDHATEAHCFVEKYCRDNDLEFISSTLTRDKKKGESPEEYWRNNRMEWLHSLKTPVVTAHHLDDVVEWWVFTSFHGIPKTIPHRNKNILRPMLLTRKKEISKWSKDKNVIHVEDPSNKIFRYARNRIRHSLMPEILNINPGIHTMVKKHLKNQIRREIEYSYGRPVC